jgi:HEAT repeat protein
MSCRHWALLALVSLVLAAPISQAEDDDKVKADLAILKAGKADTDNKGLVAFIKKRTVSDALRTKIGKLIRELGHEDFAPRQKAQDALIEIGGPARPQLHAALNDSDLEVRRRARWALEKIGPAAAEAHLVVAVARVLTARKAPGALEALLDYLPSIEEPETAEEVVGTLWRVAMVKDKPDPLLLKALSDKFAIKRWAAGIALARAGGKAQRPSVHKLLKDSEPSVRRHVALALVESRDKEGVPALIKLVNDKSTADAEAAEEALVAIAGDKAPAMPEGDTPKARDRYKKLWEGWWKDNSKGIDLAKVEFNSSPGRGFTLVGLMSYNRKGGNGKVVVLDASMKERWAVDNIIYPSYACLTRRDRMLICEFNANRVTEHDNKGKTLWTKTLSSQPVYAQRLPNGNTFIATRYQLLEVDRNGKDVKTINRPSYDILVACRHKNGSFTMISSNGQCIKLDSSGKQISAFNVGYLYSVPMKADFLPKGGVVVPDYNQSKIREYDSAGKLVRELTVDYRHRPNGVTKLPNGNYLISSRLNTTLLEIDKSGKQVSTHSVATGVGRPLFVDRK